MKAITFVLIAFLVVVSSCKKEEEDPPVKGDFIEGGIVFFVGGGLTYVVSINDLTDAQWGCDYIPDITSEYLQTGAGAAQLILDNCEERGIAARRCDNYEFGGYDDWYLPGNSIAHGGLLSIFVERNLINSACIANGGTALKSAFYWSSRSNTNLLKAEGRDFSSQGGVAGNNGFAIRDKDEIHHVRAMRTFKH